MNITPGSNIGVDNKRVVVGEGEGEREKEREREREREERINNIYVCVRAGEVPKSAKRRKQ